MFRNWLFVASFLLLLLPSAKAGAVEVREGYALPTLRELTQTVAILGGIDISQDAAFDEYAQLLYCGLYTEKYMNDFEWNKIRAMIRSRAQEKKDYYRVLYEVISPVTIGRYNFEEQSFPLINRSGLDNVGVLIIYDDTQYRFECNGERKALSIFPRVFYLSLDRPLTLTRLPMEMENAKRILDRLDVVQVQLDSSMTDMTSVRKAYVRFRVRVSGVIDVSGMSRALLRGTIEGIDFFADADTTKFIATIPLRKRRVLFHD